MLDQESTPGLESSDTESSREMEDMEDEPSPAPPPEPKLITADDMMEQLIKDAKKKARELERKSELCVLPGI